MLYCIYVTKETSNAPDIWNYPHTNLYDITYTGGWRGELGGVKRGGLVDSTLSLEDNTLGLVHIKLSG